MKKCINLLLVIIAGCSITLRGQLTHDNTHLSLIKIEEDSMYGCDIYKVESPSISLICQQSRTRTKKHGNVFSYGQNAKDAESNLYNETITKIDELNKFKIRHVQQTNEYQSLETVLTKQLNYQKYGPTELFNPFIVIYIKNQIKTITNEATLKRYHLLWELNGNLKNNTTRGLYNFTKSYLTDNY